MTSAELFAIMLARLDQAALQVGLSHTISEDERHTLIGHFTAIYWAMCTHQTLHGIPHQQEVG